MKKYHSDKKGTENLYDWCIRKGFTDILDRWDYEKNDKNPKEIYNCNINVWIKCENGKHPSEQRYLRNIINTGKIPSCTICHSFGTWCEEHSRLDLLKRWDYEKNNISPYEIPFRSGLKYWFKCPRGLHPSEQKIPCNLVTQFGSSRCNMCRSFAQWGIDNIGEDFLSEYWSDKNTKDPWKTEYQCPQKVWIKCQEKKYHPDYMISCADFINGKRCPYCAGKKVAKEDSLGYRYPESIKLWVQKNCSPYDFMPGSNKQVYWKCEKHGQYRRSIIQEVNADFVCPKCRAGMNESKLQKKVREYIEFLYDDIKHENQCTVLPINPKTKYPLPFDNEIVQLKLIIQVNGEQHYKATPFFFKKERNNEINSPEEQLIYRQKIDKYKKDYALSHGYHYLEIPYWADDKKETWKTLIDNKIADLTS